MAISLGFGPADLLRCRFARSPAFETLAAVRCATGSQGPGPHGRWFAAVRPRLAGAGLAGAGPAGTGPAGAGKPDGLDLRPLTLLQPRRGYTPDFLAPPPVDGGVEIEEELTRIAATPARVVREEIALSLRSTPGAAESEIGRILSGDPAEVLSFLTGLVRAAWEVLVEPWWPRVRALLDADIAFQARRLAEGGIERLFGDLHPTLQWTGDALVRSPGGDEHHELGGRGVVLLPSVFKWEEVVVITDPPWQPTIAYPARGLGGLWEAARGTADEALGRLVGRTRAELLGGLYEPASTTWLAHRHALALGTVSEHLGVLRAAGLVVGERHRHEVRYRRTALGDAVVRGGDPPATLPRTDQSAVL